MRKWKLFVTAAALSAALAFPVYASSFDISPGRSDTPVMEQLPDPNDPNSPERVTILEDGVPKTYIRFETPDGLYVYILEDEVPLAKITSPQTGDGGETRLMAAALASGLGAATLFAAGKRKKA